MQTIVHQELHLAGMTGQAVDVLEIVCAAFGTRYVWTYRAHYLSFWTRRPVRKMGTEEQEWRSGESISPPTNVTRVWFTDPALYVGWVCCWFSSLLRCFSQEGLNGGGFTFWLSVFKISLFCRLNFRPLSKSQLMIKNVSWLLTFIM